MHIANAGLIRFMLFFLLTILVALPSAATQQIYTVTIDLGSGNGSVTYTEIATYNITCRVDAKYTYYYTRYNDYSFAYHPVSSSQIPMAGTFTIISGSPGSYRSNCPNNGIYGSPHTLLQKDYQVYVYPQNGGVHAA